MRAARAVASFAAFWAVVAGPAAAQEPPLTTDRPDQTESPFVIRPGSVQFEVGGLHEVGSEGAAGRVTGIGSVLARIGVGAPAELRLGFLGWQRAVADGSAARAGFTDLSAGVKVALHEGTGLVPSAAVIGTLLIPVGDPDFRAAGVDPEVRVAIGHELGHGFALGYNLGAAWSTEPDGAGAESLRTGGLYTLVLGRPIGSRVGAFVEVFGTLSFQDDRPSRHTLDAGVTFAALPNVQLDAAGGFGLNAAASEWFLGLGVSVRVPR